MTNYEEIFGNIINNSVNIDSKKSSGFILLISFIIYSPS